MTTIEALLADLEADAPVRQVLVGAFWTAVVLDTDPPQLGAIELQSVGRIACCCS